MTAVAATATLFSVKITLEESFWLIQLIFFSTTGWAYLLFFMMSVASLLKGTTSVKLAYIIICMFRTANWNQLLPDSNILKRAYATNLKHESLPLSVLGTVLEHQAIQVKFFYWYQLEIQAQQHYQHLESPSRSFGFTFPPFLSFDFTYAVLSILSHLIQVLTQDRGWLCHSDWHVLKQ